MPGSIQRTVGEIGERDGTQETQEARLPPEIPKKSQRNTKIFTEKSNKFHREIQKYSQRNPTNFRDWRMRRNSGKSRSSSPSC